MAAKIRARFVLDNWKLEPAAYDTESYTILLCFYFLINIRLILTAARCKSTHTDFSVMFLRKKRFCDIRSAPNKTAQLKYAVELSSGDRIFKIG